MRRTLFQRTPKSSLSAIAFFRVRGRRGAPAEAFLRLLVRKHLRNWSYGVLEREVRANLVLVRVKISTSIRRLLEHDLRKRPA